MVLGEMPKQREAPAAAPEAEADRIEVPKLGLMLASAHGHGSALANPDHA
jgi:hypothetical protein